MTRVDAKFKWNDEKFKRRIRTTKPVFQIMLEILQTAHQVLHKNGGNRRRRHLLRTKLVCAILNAEKA